MRTLFTVIWACIVCAPVAAQGYLSTIGYTALQERLGIANTPNGLNLRIAQVEGIDSGAYSANPGLAANPGSFTMTFNGTTTNPGVYSGHANFVANNYWAAGSMASGVSQVDSWDANMWINTIVLGNGTGIPSPSYLPRVSNHSYIGTYDPPGTVNGFFEADAIAITRRADYLVDRTGHIMVVGGGNNNSNTPAPLFGNMYNGIVAGRSDGNGGGGFTTFETIGRVKPDLVAPDSSVSGATPIIASAATILVQTAGNTPDASRPETIKAVLMTGTTKAGLTNGGVGWNHTDTRPLDSRFGAGQLNINHSHMILTAGQKEASVNSTVPSTGWDYNTIDTPNGATSRTYFFDVTAGEQIVSFTATATWHRKFQDGNPNSFSLADLNLRLYSADNSFQLLGGPLEQSISSIDNSEHLYRTANMPTGRYAIVVEANGLAVTDFAVAWQFIAVPEPSLIGLAGAGLLVIVIRRRKA